MSIVVHRQPPCQENRSEQPACGRAKTYHLDRSKAFVRTKPVDDLESWARAVEEIFSTPSEDLRGEKVSVPSVSSGEAARSRAGDVTDGDRPARSLPGGITQSVQGGCSTLLDYTLTQAEKLKKVSAAQRRKLPDRVSDVKRAYRHKAIISGNVIEIFDYEDTQLSRKGEASKIRLEKESVEPTEEEKKSKRQENLRRARKGLIRQINANVGDHGQERAKFLTITNNEEHVVFDLKTGNYELKKFIQRLEYELKVKLQYTAIARFQDGDRPGGTVKGGRDGVIHHHIVIYNMPFVPQKKLASIWGRGFVWINAIDDVDNLGVYVVEGYMGKEIDDERLNGQKHYFASRGLVKPREVISLVPITERLQIKEENLAYSATYKNEWVGRVHYRQYNTKRIGGKYENKKKGAS